MNSVILPSLELEANGKEGPNVGAMLRAARESRGEDLHQVSNVLRIRYDYLEAIENDRFDELPGDIYSTGFIRSYSEYLGLDADKIVLRLKSEGTVLSKNTTLVFPAIIPEDGIPGGIIVILGLVIAIIGYFTWYWSSSSDIFVAETVPTIPSDLATSTKPNLDEPNKGAKSSLVEASSAVAAPAETSKKSNEVVERSQNSLSKVKRELIKTQKNPVNIEPRVTLGTFTSGTNTEISPEPSDNVIANKSFGETNPTDVGMEGKKSLNLLPRERQPSIENVMVQEKRNQQTSFETTANRVSDNIRLPQELANDVLVNENSTPSLPAKPDPIQAAFEDNVPDTLSSLPKRKNTEVASITNPVQNINSENKIKTPIIPKKINIDSQKTSRITLIATNTSWIQLRDLKKNRIIFSKVLLKGQSYAVPNKSGLSLMTGNAGALQITVDGKAVPNIGKLGEVRRKVLLEVKDLKSGQAVIE